MTVAICKNFVVIFNKIQRLVFRVVFDRRGQYKVDEINQLFFKDQLTC